jgi:hypothetical protein
LKDKTARNASSINDLFMLEKKPAKPAKVEKGPMTGDVNENVM